MSARVFLLALSLSLHFGTTQLSAQTAFTSSNLPIIIIDTHGQTILDEPKIAAEMTIIYNGPGARNFLTDSLFHYKGNIGIEIRGASSQMFPKKQYGLETRDAQGEDTDVSLLGFPAESDWILSASYSDKTLLHNVLAYKLGNDLGHYASRTRYCEVVLNGDYHGVFMLMEKIKRDKNRVNIAKMENTDVGGDAVTGGYIFKIDKAAGSGTQGWFSAHLPYAEAWQKIYYQYDYPNEDDIAPEQKAYLQNYVRTFENLMAREDYDDPQTGYAQMLDVASFVDYFIIQELAHNVDGYRLSAFLHKDRDSKNPKLKMGPLWDFDLAFGNADYYDGSNVNGWHVTFQVRSDAFQLPFWWTKLMEDSSFVNAIKTRWSQLRQDVITVARLNAYVDSVASLIDEGQTRNFKRWPILGTYVWPNAYIGQTYNDEIRHLKEWLQARILWMDLHIPKLRGANEETFFLPNGFALAQNYPNPIRAGDAAARTNSETKISFRLEQAARVSLKVFDLMGRERMTLMEGELPAGAHERSLSMNGLARGVYFYRLQVGGKVATRKLVVE